MPGRSGHSWARVKYPAVCKSLHMRGLMDVLAASRSMIDLGFVPDAAVPSIRFRFRKSQGQMMPAIVLAPLLSLGAGEENTMEAMRQRDPFWEIWFQKGRVLSVLFLVRVSQVMQFKRGSAFPTRGEGLANCLH